MHAPVSRSTFFTLGVVAVVAMGWAHSEGVVASSLREWRPDALDWRQDESEEEEPPILVVLVSNADSVAAVREAVSADRILARSDEAIALREGRIVAASRDAASEMIGRAGWADAPIEIVTTVARDSIRPKRAAAPPPDEAAVEIARERRGELNELSKKGTLTLPEAMRALELME